MIRYLDPNLVVAAIKAVLVADSTLENSSHLNGSSNIWSYHLPKNISGRHLVIDIVNPSPDAMQNYNIEARVHCFCPLLSNGQLDPVCNTILTRCESLLNNHILSTSGILGRPMISLGVIPSYVEELKGHGILRLELRVSSIA